MRSSEWGGVRECWSAGVLGVGDQADQGCSEATDGFDWVKMVKELVFAAGVLLMLVGWMLHLFLALKRAANAARVLRVEFPEVAESMLAGREENQTGWRHLGDVKFLWHIDVVLAALKSERLQKQVHSARRLIWLLPVTACLLVVGAATWHDVCAQTLEPRAEDARLRELPR